jgi:N-formylglutamate deformylase
LLPLLISVPHGGRDTPPEIADRVCLSPADLFEDGDACTRDIYDLTGEAARIQRAEIARAFVDLNRAPDDRPPANPDGVVKSATCYGHPIYHQARQPADELIERLLDRYYYPYHARLREAAADPAIRLALDCHSMAAVAPPVAPDSGAQRPLFCLSNDDGKSCPPPILDRLAAALAQAFGCDLSQVWLNRPFKGGYITRSHGGGPLPWVQVEMNRSAYLAEPWFHRESLTVDPRRLTDLRQRFLRALAALNL